MKTSIFAEGFPSLKNFKMKNEMKTDQSVDDDDDDDGWPMVGDLHVVASGHRETTALMLIVIYVAEIQN